MKPTVNSGETATALRTRNRTKRYDSLGATPSGKISRVVAGQRSALAREENIVNLPLPNYFRGMAEKSRELALRMNDEATKDHLLDFAEQYDWLAAQAERGQS